MAAGATIHTDLTGSIRQDQSAVHSPLELCSRKIPAFGRQPPAVDQQHKHNKTARNAPRSDGIKSDNSSLAQNFCNKSTSHFEYLISRKSKPNGFVSL